MRKLVYKIVEETENSPASMKTKKLTKNSSFKMNGWGGYNK